VNRTRKPKVGNKVKALLRFATIADAGRDFAMRSTPRKANGTRSAATAKGHDRSNHNSLQTMQPTPE
jgi:hypothetical protein